jgi:gamma-glutamyltranspeptidase/glutathione hydrolase
MFGTRFPVLWAGALVLLFFSCQTPRPAGLAYPYRIEKVAVADSAMVVSAHPQATRVGLEVLRRGGNAIDAAVAVQFALAVVYPGAGNIGGGGFLVYRGADGQTTTLDYRERAPAGATETMYLYSAGQVLPEKSRFGILAAGIPGTVDGLWESHRRYGRRPWKELVEPAAALAEGGFAITDQEAQGLNADRENFIRYNEGSAPAFVRPAPWQAGDRLVQQELARTLRRVAERGRSGFYEGPTADLIVRESQRRGGLITHADLKTYQSVWRQPLEFDYRGYRVVTMPPPSSGGIILRQLLGMMELKMLPKEEWEKLAGPGGPTREYPYGLHSVDAVHLMAEAERRAFADRAVHHGDPDFAKVPVKTMTSAEYLKKRMSDFDPARATPSAQSAAGKISEETTHLSIIDAEGNAASVTTTLNDRYGSRVVVEGAGFLLNNEMDDFSAKPGAPNLYGAIGGKANAVAPGKRPLSSMTPTIVLREGQVWMVLGTPGGTTIPTTVFQMLVNTIDFNLSLPDAVQAKRFHHQWQPDAIQIEEGALSAEVQQKLREMGHTITVRGPIGRVEAIRRLDHRWQGVADPRGDDSAGGY